MSEGKIAIFVPYGAMPTGSLPNNVLVDRGGRTMSVMRSESVPANYFVGSADNLPNNVLTYTGEQKDCSGITEPTPPDYDCQYLLGYMSTSYGDSESELSGSNPTRSFHTLPIADESLTNIHWLGKETGSDDGGVWTVSCYDFYITERFGLGSAGFGSTADMNAIINDFGTLDDEVGIPFTASLPTAQAVIDYVSGAVSDVTDVEIEYLSGVTGSIQDQLDSKKLEVEVDLAVHDKYAINDTWIYIDAGGGTFNLMLKDASGSAKGVELVDDYTLT